MINPIISPSRSLSPFFSQCNTLSTFLLLSFVLLWVNPVLIIIDNNDVKILPIFFLVLRSSFHNCTTFIISLRSFLRCLAEEIQCDIVFSTPFEFGPDCNIDRRSPFSSTMMDRVASRRGSSNEVGSDRIFVLWGTVLIFTAWKKVGTRIDGGKFFDTHESYMPKE